jgi:hypothetical protein
VTKVLVLNSHNRKIHSIFLITIAAAERSRYSNFWARRGSGAVGFLFLSRRRGSGALAFFFYRRGAVAVSFQPRWTSLARRFRLHLLFSANSKTFPKKILNNKKN